MSEPAALEHCLVVDLRIYRLEALKRSLYRFSSEATLVGQLLDDQTVRVDIAVAAGEAANESLRKAFLADLIDQEMRCVVQEKTASIRNVIIAQAYTPVSLACAASNTPDWESDPLQVDKPDKAKQESERVPQ